MEPITTSIVTGDCFGIPQFSTDAVKHFFGTVFSIQPELENRLIGGQPQVLI